MRRPGEGWMRRVRGGICLLAVLGLVGMTALIPQTSGTAKNSGLDTPPAASAYAGDEACAACHAKEAKTYAGTPHALDSSEASGKTILGNFTPGKNVVATPYRNLIFAMIAAPDAFYESVVNIADPQNPTGRAERFDIVVGSGRHGQTYLYWTGSDLYELPVSYWGYTHAWINSPGYADGGIHFDRPVMPRCLECHATRFETNGPPPNRYVRSSLVLGIGCETCHGPGAEHVRREESARPPAAGSSEIAIVNPARLARDRQMDLCGLCHAGPGEPLAKALSYRPGDVLADYVKIDVPPADAPVDVHGNQVNALERSRCFTSGKLTCSTCHDVHRTQETAEAFSAKCLTCHAVRACGRYAQMGESLRGKCVGCHMPIGKSEALTSQLNGQMLQAEMRTHRIAVYR